jgi:hypothetical protein
MKVQLSPVQQMAIFSCVGAVIVGLASKAIALPPGTPAPVEAMAEAYAQWAVNLWAIVGGTLLAAFGNSKPGPLAPADPPIVIAATKAAEAADAAEAKVAK